MFWNSVGYKTFFFCVSLEFLLSLARASLVKNYAIYIVVILWSVPCARSKILLFSRSFEPSNPVSMLLLVFSFYFVLFTLISFFTV